MMHKKILTTIFLLLLPVICLSGVWQNYSNESPDGAIIYHDGFIWGTSGAGLWRYDPAIDKYDLIYPSDWMESGGKIVNFMVSRKGDLWFVINNVGLAKYDGIDWKFYDPKEESLYNFGYGGIAEDTEGKIWITVEKGLAYLENDHLYFIDKIGETPLPVVSQILLTNDNKGNLWVLFKTDSNNLACKTNDQWTIYPFPEGYGTYDPGSDFFADSKGGVWFSANVDDVQRIIRFLDGAFEPFLDRTFVFLDGITEDQNGIIWLIASFIYKIQGDEWETYEPPPLYPDLNKYAYPKAITTLPDGSVWVFVRDGSSGPAVGFTILRNGELTRHDIVFSDFPDTYKISSRGKHGAITGTSSHSPICEFKDIEKQPKDFISLEYTKPSVGGNSHDIFIDSSDRIWWTAQSFFISFLEGVPTYHKKETWWPPQGDSRAITEGTNGTIWLAMEEQLFSYKDNVWTQASMTTYSSCSSIAVDTFGVVWMAGGMYGLSKYDGVDRYMVSVPATVVNDVSADTKGGVWVASSSSSPSENQGGLYYVNGESITRFTEQNGLPSRSIQKVAVASDNSVWLSWMDFYENDFGETSTSTGGVCHFDVGNPNIEVYRPEDGLASYNVSDIAVSDLGIVWFATDAGLSTLDLNATPDPKIRTGVNKYNLKAGDEFKLGINLQNRGPQRTVKLVTALLYNDTTLYFDFTSAQFTPNFSALPVTFPENLKLNTEIWKLGVPAGLEGKQIIFGSALLDGGSSEIIGKISIETINFIQ